MLSIMTETLIVIARAQVWKGPLGASDSRHLELAVILGRRARLALEH